MLTLPGARQTSWGSWPENFSPKSFRRFTVRWHSLVAMISTNRQKQSWEKRIEIVLKSRTQQMIVRKRYVARRFYTCMTDVQRKYWSLSGPVRITWVTLRIRRIRYYDILFSKNIQSSLNQLLFAEVKITCTTAAQTTVNRKKYATSHIVTNY